MFKMDQTFPDWIKVVQTRPYVQEKVRKIQNSQLSFVTLYAFFFFVSLMPPEGDPRVLVVKLTQFSQIELR